MKQPLQHAGVALPAGHELLWYETRSVLGYGGFGITYLAHDKNLGREVALKEYLPRAWADRQPDHNVAPLNSEHAELYHKGLSSFMIEARTLAKFKHPNIVQVLAVFEQHNTAYIAMEYEHGGSLAELLKSGKFVASEESLKGIMMPIIEGLQKVHEMGFLHRDIKPSNIYLRDDGSPVLIDFGSSRQTGQVNTGDVTILITQGYTPAEQYSKSFGDQGPWTDIYALAASAYHAISGWVVTDALQRNTAELAGLPDPFKPLNLDEFPAYSGPFLLAINKALSVKPGDRPQSLSIWQQLLDGGLAEGVQKPADAFAVDNTVLLPLHANQESDDVTERQIPQTPTFEADATNTFTNNRQNIAESVNESFSPIPEPLEFTKTIEQPSGIDETTHKPVTPSRKPLTIVVAGLAASALLATAAFVIFGNQQTSITSSPSAGQVTLNSMSPVELLSEDIYKMKESLVTHKRILEGSGDTGSSLQAIEDIGKKFLLLANSPIVQGNRELGEQVADGLVNSVGVNPTTQKSIIKLIQGPSEATEESIKTLLTTTSDLSVKQASFFALAFATPEKKHKLLATPEFAQLMDRIYTKIDNSIGRGQLEQATRMIELALLLQPEDKQLRAYFK